MWRTLREISGTTTPRVKIYFVSTYASAPAHGEAKKWVRNEHLRLQAQAGTNGRCVLHAREVIDYRHFGTHDSRYSGPRSSYGQASATMRRAANKLCTLSAPASAIPCGEHPGSLPGDLYLTRQPGNYYRRVGWDGKTCGLAMRRTVESGLRAIWPVALDTDGRYWEHGDSIAAICLEEEHKRRSALVKRATKRDERRARLLARISEQIMVCRADARAVGACDAGINTYCTAHNLADQIPARDLVRLAIATRQPLALRAAMHAAMIATST